MKQEMPQAQKRQVGGNAPLSGGEVTPEEFDDGLTLMAAARFIESAAFSLAYQLDSSNVARLLVISHELTVLAKGLRQTPAPQT